MAIGAESGYTDVVIAVLFRQPPPIRQSLPIRQPHVGPKGRRLYEQRVHLTCVAEEVHLILGDEEQVPNQGEQKWHP